MKREFRKKIRLIAVGLGLAMFCFSCATAPPKPEESGPALRVEAAPAARETPPAAPAPAPEPSQQEAQAEAPKPDPAVQEPPPPPPPAKETKPLPVFHSHTVKYSGETLSIIALWYTGDHGNWKEISRVNPDLNPNRIFPGNEILIPEGLLKTRDPFSKEYVDRISSKANKDKGKPRAQTVQTQLEEPKLFGPKKTNQK